MIYFTINSDSQLTVGEAIELTSDGSKATQRTSGQAVGVVMSSVETGENTGIWTNKVYVAGGGGTSMILSSSWDGTLTRFEYDGARVRPVTSGGVGWLIPDYPALAHSAGDVVKGSLYS